jgi:hypothetical protein
MEYLAGTVGRAQRAGCACEILPTPLTARADSAFAGNNATSLAVDALGEGLRASASAPASAYAPAAVVGVLRSAFIANNVSAPGGNSSSAAPGAVDGLDGAALLVASPANVSLVQVGSCVWVGAGGGGACEVRAGASSWGASWKKFY